MNTIEIFSGTGSFSKVMNKHNHTTLMIDNNKELFPDLCINMLKINVLPDCDLLWCSPPCTTFSVASISRHWTGGFRKYEPKDEVARIGLSLLDKTIRLIKETNKTYWFIENPRGVMRKVIDDIFKSYDITDYHRVTVWYCQYGDKRAKPTDIWTNLPNWNGRSCHNNNKECHHELSPRGSKTGTQGLKNAKERGQIPSELFEEILTFIPREIKCKPTV